VTSPQPLVVDTATDRVSGPPPGPDTRSGFSVDPIVLIGTAGVFDAEAAAVKMMVTRLEQRLAAIGKVWGDDTVGARFGAAYEPASRMVLANLASLSAGLVRIAAALRAVGESYESADNIFVSGVPMIGPMPPPVVPVGVVPRPRAIAVPMSKPLAVPLSKPLAVPMSKPMAVAAYSPVMSNPIDETSGG
jgi:uncharacterized protein YukE